MEKKHAKTPKEKRRNMERRKEKSRDAARCRRGKETEIFTDLSALLPLPPSKVAHLDKASIIRVAISYLKVRAVIESIPTKENKQTEIKGCNTDSLFVDSLEGFLLVTSTDGDIVFISENVNRYLGLQQVEVLGQSIYELSHPCDHAEIKEMLSTKDANIQKSYFLRMKWSPKGRSVNVNKTTQYKVIQYTGRVIHSQPKTGEKEVNNNGSADEGSDDDTQIVSNTPAYHFVAIGEAIWHPANIEVPLGRNTFLSKHSLDMKYTYADERIVEFFGYNPEALIKKSIYDYHHAQDTAVIKNCFKNLFEKGQSQTERYRFLALGGGYAWVVTQSTLIYNNNQKPLSVVCVNFIVSGVENKNEIYSLCQLDNTCASSLTEADSSSVGDSSDDGYVYENSPQQLIEKLRINTNPSPFVTTTAKAAAATATATTTAKNRYSPLTPSTTDNNQRPRNNLVIKKNPSTKNHERKTDILPAPLALDIGEFLTPPSSTSPQSCGSSPPEDPINEFWLMNENQKDSAFYGLTVPSIKTAPAKVAESDHNAEQIKIEIRATNESLNDSVKASDIPKPATADVFVPLTEEMNKGFLGFTEDDTGLTMLKEDPEDLTHLAPTAGGVCVPLDEGPIDYVIPDMLDEIMISDCNFLPSDTDRDLSSSSPNSFFSYRDDLEPSSRPISPILAQNEDCSIPSFCSDDSSLNDTTVSHFLDFGLISAADEMDDLSGKPSYIPLSLDQDPLLPFVTNDFMWGSSSGESSTWSSVPSSPTSNCSLSPRLDHTSSLAKLLKAEPICNYDGGGGDRNDVNGGGATKNRFGGNVNSLADRNYSNVSNFKTVAYHRNINGINESNRRRTNAVKKETNNHRSEDKRKSSQVTIGSKRSMSENWGRGANSCKRSKQTSRTIIINGGGSGNNRRIQHTAAMAEAVATAKQTNSVLMNLLVSGCDLNAGYDEDFKDTNRRVCSSSGNMDKNTANRLNYEMKNDRVNAPNSKCWSPFKRKSVSLLESESSQIPSLMDLTEQDYAVNAPSAGELLQGCDLLKALECATII